MLQNKFMDSGQETNESIIELINCWSKLNNIPIDKIQYLKDVDLQRFKKLSQDFTSCAQILEEKEVTVVEIYQVKSNQLLHKMKIHLQNPPYFFEFSAEFLIYMVRNDKMEIYLHNFKLDQGIYINIDARHCEAFYFKKDQFQLLFLNNTDEQQVHRIDQDSHSQQTIQITNGIQQHQSECPFNLTICLQRKYLCFLTPQFKIINRIFIKNIHYLTLTKQFILMKNFFLAFELFSNKAIICQNRNGKRIRTVQLNIPQKFIQMKHLLFIHLSSNNLIIYDLQQGILIKSLESLWLTDINIVDNYMFFETHQENIGIYRQ